MLVYETEPLAEPVEVTGRGEVTLRIASSALDTDFTAKLIDVYPPSEDYPGRLRHADQRLDHPLPLPQRLRARGADGARDGSTR